MPRKFCLSCGVFKCKPDFALFQFKDTNGVCKRCMAIKVQTGTPLKCNKCQAWKCEAAFLPHQRTHFSTTTRICTDCEDTRVCVVCKANKTQNASQSDNGNLQQKMINMVNASNAWKPKKVDGHVEDAAFLPQLIISVFGLPIENLSIGYTLPVVMHVKIKL